MRLILTTVSIAIVIGYLAGGRLSGLARLDLRWPALALLGVALQFAPWSGMPGFVALLLSFAGLIAFALANARQAGFVLIVVGLAMNLTVIAVNQGMPVTRTSLVRSGQADTLASLVDDGGNKHHLAGPTDALVVLGDWIPVEGPSGSRSASATSSCTSGSRGSSSWRCDGCAAALPPRTRSRPQRGRASKWRRRRHRRRACAQKRDRSSGSPSRSGKS